MTAAADQSPTPDTRQSGDITWQITDWTPDRPFTGRLVWADDHGPLVWADLDPILVRDLFEKLAIVHLAQREALGLPVDPAPETIPLDEGLDDDPLSDGATELDAMLDTDGESGADTRPWRKRHWILFPLLMIVGACMLYAFLAGSLSV